METNNETNALLYPLAPPLLQTTELSYLFSIEYYNSDHTTLEDDISHVMDASVDSSVSSLVFIIRSILKSSQIEILDVFSYITSSNGSSKQVIQCHPSSQNMVCATGIVTVSISHPQSISSSQIRYQFLSYTNDISNKLENSLLSLTTTTTNSISDGEGSKSVNFWGYSGKEVMSIPDIRIFLYGDDDNLLLNEKENEEPMTLDQVQIFLDTLTFFLNIPNNVNDMKVLGATLVKQTLVQHEHDFITGRIPYDDDDDVHVPHSSTLHFRQHHHQDKKHPHPNFVSSTRLHSPSSSSSSAITSSMIILELNIQIEYQPPMNFHPDAILLKTVSDNNEFLLQTLQQKEEEEEGTIGSLNNNFFSNVKEISLSSSTWNNNEFLHGGTTTIPKTTTSKMNNDDDSNNNNNNSLTFSNGTGPLDTHMYLFIPFVLLLAFILFRKKMFRVLKSYVYKCVDKKSAPAQHR